MNSAQIREITVVNSPVQANYLITMLHELCQETVQTREITIVNSPVQANYLITMLHELGQVE